MSINNKRFLKAYSKNKIKIKKKNKIRGSRSEQGSPQEMGVEEGPEGVERRRLTPPIPDPPQVR